MSRVSTKKLIQLIILIFKCKHLGNLIYLNLTITKIKSKNNTDCNVKINPLD